MPRDKGQKTPGEQAKEGVDETGLAGPERDDAGSIGEGGAPTGPTGPDAGNAVAESSEGDAPAADD